MPATQGTGFPELTHYILVELQRKNIPPCAICSLFNRIVNLEQKVISKSKDGMVKKSSVHSIFLNLFSLPDFILHFWCTQRSRVVRKVGKKACTILIFTLFSMVQLQSSALGDQNPWDSSGRRR